MLFLLPKFSMQNTMMRVQDTILVQELPLPIKSFNLKHWSQVQELISTHKQAFEIALINPWMLVNIDTLEIS